MEVSDVPHLHPLTDWHPHGGPGSMDVNGVHIPECWMIHAVVSLRVVERGYLLGEHPGAPEAAPGTDLQSAWARCVSTT